jgi:hypothetical protein
MLRLLAEWLIPGLRVAGSSPVFHFFQINEYQCHYYITGEMQEAEAAIDAMDIGKKAK